MWVTRFTRFVMLVEFHDCRHFTSVCATLVLLTGFSLPRGYHGHAAVLDENIYYNCTDVAAMFVEQTGEGVCLLLLANEWRYYVQIRLVQSDSNGKYSHTRTPTLLICDVAQKFHLIVFLIMQ